MKISSLTAVISLALALISCEKPSTNTTYVYENRPETTSNTKEEIPVSAITDLDPQLKPEPDPIPKNELLAIAGSHKTGKLFLRYNVTADEVKKWNILAPFEVKIEKDYLEVSFSGNYYMDGEPTGKGRKHLFIKKENIRTILLSEE